MKRNKKIPFAAVGESSALIQGNRIIPSPGEDTGVTASGEDGSAPFGDLQNKFFFNDAFTGGAPVNSSVTRIEDDAPDPMTPDALPGSEKRTQNSIYVNSAQVEMTADLPGGETPRNRDVGRAEISPFRAENEIFRPLCTYLFYFSELCVKVFNNS